MIKKINKNKLQELWEEAVRQCKKDVMENVVLGGTFDISEIQSDFIKHHLEDAALWEEPEKPEELLINHGHYINKGGKEKKIKGIDFIIEELKNKNYGNRACYSLINMEDIVGSEDRAIPSFMILQFGFSKKDINKLLVSAYFRALEVKEFLPINLAEICMNIDKIKEKFPNIKKFELNIFVFRAQYIEKFNCLRHSQLDILDSALMTKYLVKDKKKIIEALKDKKRSVESVIVNAGMISLKKAVEITDEEDLKNKPEVQEMISIILDKMNKIKAMRASTSIQEEIKPESDKIEAEFDKLIGLMEENI